MHITGPRDGPPVKVGVAVTDLTTGLYTANAILASLIARTTSAAQHPPKGLGTYIDASLADCQLATLTNVASSVLVSSSESASASTTTSASPTPPSPPSQAPEQQGGTHIYNPGRWGTAHPSIVPYQAFATQTTLSSPSRTGNEILLGGGNDKLFATLSTSLGHSEWASDIRFSTNATRVANRNELISLIETETTKQPLSHWLAVFASSGVPHAAVNDVPTALLKHEQTIARGVVGTVQHKLCGELKVVNGPVVYGGMSRQGEANGRVGARTPPPWLCQHTQTILEDSLGMSKEEVDGLRERGVVA